MKHPQWLNHNHNSIISWACLEHLRWHRLHPGVRDFEVTVGVQKNLDGAWRLRAVLNDLKENATTPSKETASIQSSSKFLSELVTA